MKRSLNIVALLVAIALVACEAANKGESDVSGDVTTQNGFTIAYNDYLKNCAACHAPGAPGRTSDIEQSLDFSTVYTAYSTVKGSASGLTMSREACNGVKFIGDSYETSLLIATLDEDVRASFAVGDCNQDAVSDMTVKVGFAPSKATLNALKNWIESGTPSP